MFESKIQFNQYYLKMIPYTLEVPRGRLKIFEILPRGLVQGARLLRGAAYLKKKFRGACRLIGDVNKIDYFC